MRIAEMEAIANQLIRCRESTLKRLRNIPSGKEHWRPVPRAMSAADTASHLLACDAAYIDAAKSGRLGANLGCATTEVSMARADYDSLLDRLEGSAGELAVNLRAMDEDVLGKPVQVIRKDGSQRLSMREVLMTLMDHEAHHRGQVVVYLKLVSA